jgi:hypothetical protein
MKPSVSDVDFSSSDVRNALKMAFTEFWRPEDKEFSEGLRGIHTIGEKTGNDYEDWSIMNYFDTKQEVKSLINKKWKEDGTGDKIEWLSNIFKTDDDFLKKLLDIQWNSIKNGIKNESDAIKSIIDYLNKKGINVEVEYYPPGHKKDRKEGIDFTLKPENKGSFTIQVKPLTKIEETFNNKIKVHTYGMKNLYKANPKLDFIVYALLAVIHAPSMCTSISFFKHSSSILSISSLGFPMLGKGIDKIKGIFSLSFFGLLYLRFGSNRLWYL